MNTAGRNSDLDFCRSSKEKIEVSGWQIVGCGLHRVVYGVLDGRVGRGWELCYRCWSPAM